MACHLIPLLFGAATVTTSTASMTALMGGHQMDQMVMKALYSMGIGAVTSIAWYNMGVSDSVEVLGLPIPAPLAIGMATAGGTVAAEVAHAWILPKVMGTGYQKNMPSYVVGVATAGLGTLAILRIMGSSSAYSWDGMILGGGSYAASEFISANFTYKLTFP
jgi:hypothetical protein